MFIVRCGVFFCAYFKGLGLGCNENKKLINSICRNNCIYFIKRSRKYNT